VAGVAAAREEAGGHARLLSGLEFNRVAGCDTGLGQPCVLTEVAPHVDADLWSFSSYEALAAPPDQLGAAIHDALDRAYAVIAAAHPDLERAQLMLGEFGFPREAPGYGDCSTGQRVATTVAAAQDWGVSYAIFWQLLDNVRKPGEVFFGFGAHRADGSLSLAGEVLADQWEDGRVDAVQSAGCPVVALGGVIDALDYDTKVAAGGYVSLYGLDLAGDRPEDLVVQFAHQDVLVTVDARSPHFFASDAQVNAQVPNVFAPGETVLVWITRGDGLDSGGGLVTIE
jgi:hypothetical protein